MLQQASAVCEIADPKPTEARLLDPARGRWAAGWRQQTIPSHGFAIHQVIKLCRSINEHDLAKSLFRRVNDDSAPFRTSPKLAISTCRLGYFMWRKFCYLRLFFAFVPVQDLGDVHREGRSKPSAG